MKAENTAFWKGQRRTPAKSVSPKESMMSSRKTGIAGARNKTEE